MVSRRVQVLEIFILGIFGLIIFRLFYWQVLANRRLEALGLLQYQTDRRLEPLRGEILSQDGYTLVSNRKRYTLYAYKPSLTLDPALLTQKLVPLLANPQGQASLSAEITEAFNKPSQWIPLARGINDETKSRITSLDLKGIGFDETYTRFYPESSLSAQILGFVGSNKDGYPQGYFGLEGFYNRELTGKPGFVSGESDVFGRPILYGDFNSTDKIDGRTLKTYLDRGLQLLVENELKQGLIKYQASAGEVAVMEPQTGAILALAAFPDYDPNSFYNYPGELYRVPAIADTYEPGSTFKTVVMSAAVNENLVTPDTVCDQTCNGPVHIGQYDIRTWNNRYNPGETMRQVLERSDNTGMVFVAQKFDKNKFIQYLKDFGIGQPSNIDLESETTVPLKERWGDIDIATAAFGQGVAVNSIQMLMAVGAIANQGKRMEPHVVKSLTDASGTNIAIAPKLVKQVITPQSAAVMTDLMIAAARHGEAQWTIPSWLQIAGKTGTAQVPIAGHYDANKTIASFIGFAPANNPKFVMLVKLKEPQVSPWASETAAPLWVKLAKDIYLYYNIEPGS